MSEFGERVQDLTSRFNLRDRKTQLGIASGIAAVVLLIALIALPGSGKKTTNAAEDTSGTKTSNALTPTTSSVRSLTGGTTRSPRSVGIPNAPAQTNTYIPPGVQAAPPGVNAQGVTDKEILVGATYDKNAGGLNKAIGFAGVGQIDQKAADEHLRDYVNSHGGIGGRKIKLIWYVGDSLSGKSLQQFAEESCKTFTQDNHVFAAFGPVGDPDAFHTCMTKAGVVEIGQNAGADSTTYKKYPYFISVGDPTVDRFGRFEIDQLYQAGFYKSGVWNCTCDRTSTAAASQPKFPFKLGILAYDSPTSDRAIDVMKAELKKHGITPVVQQIKQLQSEADIAGEVAANHNAEQKFAAEHVTHMQFIGNGSGFLEVIFWQWADKQRYFPRYGLSSFDVAQALIGTYDSAEGEGASRRAFQNAVGVGWGPLADVPRSDYSGSKELPALQKCKRILSYETYDDSARNKEAIAAIMCDQYFYLKQAIEIGGLIVNQRSWLYGVANIGAFASAQTFDGKTTADRHDGMGAIKDTAYFDNCNCFHYTSAIKNV